MTLSPGTRLGPYEVRNPLGSGGMGEVYRARDTRLGRDVAVKVLPESCAASPELLQRFEQEARAIGALSHPNVVAVFDVGRHERFPYVVCELLEGVTLRERLAAGPLTRRKALEYALQIARGLAAAHGRGVVHRDLKPENLLVTHEGRVKILDFGLAKLRRSSSDDPLDDDSSGPSLHTEPGTVLGTAGYMSPEQVRAVVVDHRTDLFSFGAILYEMLVGRRAFVGETPVETMHAILTQEPPPLGGEDGFSPGLVRLVERCLEKSPGERFQSANDLAFALETLSNHSGHAAGLDAGGAPSAWRLWTAVALLVLGAAVPLAFLAGRDAERQPPASFTRLSLRRGTILHARFAPDGQTAVYSGAWGGEAPRVFLVRPGSPESPAHGLPDAELLAVSSRGEMALSLGSRPSAWTATGTLAQAPLAGGAPRELLEHVQQADWHPDGRRLAAVRERGGRRQLEFPVGTVLHETDGWIGAVRFSPRGDRIAFAHHPELDDDGGSVMVADLEGGARSVWGPRPSITGLAWRPGADELWISSADDAHTSRLDAVTPAGRQRLIARFADRLSLHDIARDGRVLLTRDLLAAGMRVHRAGAASERDISWLDASLAADVSRDGRALLFSEGASQARAVYLQLDGGAPVRLGEGRAAALSPDRRWALAIPRDAPARLLLLPTGTGSARTLSHHGISAYHWAGFMPDGARVVFSGSDAEGTPGLYVGATEDGHVRAMALAGVSARPSRNLLTPDGRFVLAPSGESGWRRHPVDGGPWLELAGLRPGDEPLHWSDDGRWLYLREGRLPLRLWRVEADTGRREPWLDLMPADPAGVRAVLSVLPLDGGRACIYTYFRVLNDLFVAEGYG